VDRLCRIAMKKKRTKWPWSGRTGKTRLGRMDPAWRTAELAAELFGRKRIKAGQGRQPIWAPTKRFSTQNWRLEAICQAMRRFAQRNQAGRYYAIFSDSQAALRRCISDKTGLGQAQGRAIIDWEKVLNLQNCTAALRWVPSHRGVPGMSKRMLWPN
jgi:hypothetical protein